MKFLLPVFMSLISTALIGRADDYPISVERLPQTVTAAVQEYFPGSEIVSAMVDEDDDRRELNLRIEHKDLLLRVEARPDGRIREVDLDRGYRGLAALLGREASLAPVAVKELPASVTESLAAFFPNSEVLAASAGVNDEGRFYRVRTRHKNLVLRVDITRSGRILDIDTVK
jgi:hypothetical protein